MTGFHILYRQGRTLRRVVDKPGGSAYFHAMLGRAAAFLAILSFAVVTAMTMLHAVRIPPDDSRAAHAGHVMAAAGPTCDMAQPCDKGDAASCAVACAGLSVFIPPVAEAALARHVMAGPIPPAERLLHGQSPGLDDRPPRNRLL